ncbi:hypothetical protein D3C87_1843710 [compost metagenome]
MLRVRVGDENIVKADPVDVHGDIQSLDAGCLQHREVLIAECADEKAVNHRNIGIQHPARVALNANAEPLQLSSLAPVAHNGAGAARQGQLC